MSFAIVMFLLVMQFMAMYMADIAGKGLTFDILGRLFYYATAKMVLMALPVSLLAAGLMTMGSMGEHYELAAIKACGINLFRLSLPLIIFSVLLTLWGINFSFHYVPKANLKFFSLLYDVQRKKAEIAIQPGYSYYDIDGYMIRISDKNKKTGMMYDFILYNHTESRGNVDVIHADSAKMMLEPGYTQLRLVLYHGARYEDYRPENGKNTYAFGRTYFDSLYYRMQLSGFGLDRTDEQLFARHQITMVKDSLIASRKRKEKELAKDEQMFLQNIRPYSGVDSGMLFKELSPQEADTVLHRITLNKNETVLDKIDDQNTTDILRAAIGNVSSMRNSLTFRKSEIKEDKEQMFGYWFELYSMYALPCNCILFMLIGISFGAIIRKGGLGLPSLVSIAFFVIFYVLTIQGKKFGKDELISPLMAACLPIIVLTPVAIAALYQATTDASIFDESVRDMWRDRLANWLGGLWQKVRGRA